MFHIPCIQKWVKDGVYQQTNLSDEHFPNRELPWFWYESDFAVIIAQVTSLALPSC